MKVKIVIEQRGEALFQYEVEIAAEGDLAEGAKQAFAEFRKAFPGKSLFDEDITVAFDKV